MDGDCYPANGGTDCGTILAMTKKRTKIVSVRRCDYIAFHVVVSTPCAGIKKK